MSHISVLCRELIEGLAICPQGCYLDATVGAGGHSRWLLASDPQVQVIAIDQDITALTLAQENLAEFGERVQFWQGNFAEYPAPPDYFDGIFADLGVSSMQLDTPERGFSFRHLAPLDMRMNTNQSTTAADLINHESEIELARIFYEYGEERLSRRLARQIVQHRPLHTTTELADLISRSVPQKYRYGRIHPATRVFQALRIAVNQELKVLETFLQKAPLWLKPGGRIGIISFHSLEDRYVKHQFKDSPLLQVLTKKPLQPQAEEITRNPRARSAKLRLAQRV